MKEGARKMLVGLGAAAAAMGVVSAGAYGMSRCLLRCAMDREFPKVMEKGRDRLMGGSGGLGQIMDQVERAGKRLENRACTTVQITAHDGTRLIGHWFENPNARRILVAMHGWRSSWSQDFGMVADFFEEQGCSVLYAEQRGQNQSGGEHITFGLLERFDCLQWVRWVQEHTLPGLPTYLVGVSMGATTVLMAAGLELPGYVRGIVADCGFTSPHDIWKYVAQENLHLRYCLCDDWAERLCRKRIRMGTRQYSTLDAMAVCQVPVLFIHGAEDSFVPINMTYENYKACAAPKQLLVVPGAGHAMSYFTETGRYRQALLDFWRLYDRGCQKKP